MKTKLPLVSVIMNCYNGEEFLKKAIDSIYAQTYKNWEIVFLDNSSTDQSSNIALSYDKKLRYFKSGTTEPLPLYKAKSLAVEKANGDFLAFLDCDDWWDACKLEKQVPLFDNPLVGFVFGPYWLENETNSTRKIITQKLNSPNGNILDDLLKQYTIGLLTLMVRSSAYNQLERGFDSRFSVMGDFDLVIRLSACWESDHVNEPIAHYRWHGDNFSINNPQKSVDELEDWYQLICNHSIISKSKELFNIPIIIDYVRGMHFMRSNMKRKGLRLLTKIPFFRKETLKLVVAFLLPKFVLKALTR